MRILSLFLIFILLILQIGLLVWILEENAEIDSPKVYLSKIPLPETLISLIAPLHRFFKQNLNLLGRSLLTLYGSSSLPILEGTLEIDKSVLPNSISIQRDKFGFPSIYAKTHNELFFGQGFVQGQDRLWQLEASRLASQGKLSFLFGSELLEVDKVMRTLGFHRLGKRDEKELQKSPQMYQFLQSFVNGINSFMLHNLTQLPLEFRILGHKPSLFTITDILTFARFTSWQMGKSWDIEVIRILLENEVGAEKASELNNEYVTKWYPVKLAKKLEQFILHPKEKLDASTQTLTPEYGGSNAWVISGKYTKSGHPILCNDPHLPLSTPGIWHPVQLFSEEGWNITGFSIPLLPGINLGKTENIAWGITLSRFDIEDLFVEHIKETDGQVFYEYKNEWQKATVYNEEIQIKNKPSVNYRVIETIHGPIISEVYGYGENIALCSTALNSPSSLSGFFQLLQSKNWGEFLDGASKIQSPPLNILYVDKEGNIGYVPTGAVPIRAKGEGNVISEGWTGEDDWKGFIRYEELPKALNPSRGFVASANQKIIADKDFPYSLGEAFGTGWRARRITELIQERIDNHIKFEPSDCKKMQMDIISIPAIVFTKEILSLFPTNSSQALDEDATLSLSVLSSWQPIGEIGVDSSAACVYHVLRRRLFRNIFEPTLGFNLTTILMGTGIRPLIKKANDYQGFDIDMLLKLLQQPNSWWMKNCGGAKKIVAQSLSETTRWLKTRFGSSNPSDWKWGTLHETTFVHPFGRLYPGLFNLGPLRMGGDTETLAMSSLLPHTGFSNSGWAVSLRFIVDMAEPSKMEYVTAPGVSGHFSSSNYQNLLPLWLKGEYITLWTNYNSLKNQQHFLVLQPKKEM